MCIWADNIPARKKKMKNERYCFIGFGMDLTPPTPSPEGEGEDGRSRLIPNN
jgi:hypothetical protein